MYVTLRGVLLVLVVTPLWIASAQAPALTWVALGYGIVALLLLVLDWRRAGGTAVTEIARIHDDRLSLGADNPIRLRVRNLTGRSQTLTIRDEAPVEFRVDTHIINGVVAPFGEWTGHYHVHPLRRGDYRFGDIVVRKPGPLGLMVRQVRYPASADVKVYPNLLSIRRYDLLLHRNRLQELGLRTTRLLGGGTEFERLREYRPDDDFRSINWKATARTHRPITTQYQTERSRQVMALIDLGRMMQTPVDDMAKIDYVINAVLLLAYVAAGKGDRVGVMSFAADIRHYARPRPGQGQFYRILETLYGIEAEAVEPDYARALAYLAQKERKRSLVVLFTDLSSGVGVDALINHLAVLARRSLPLVVTISDPAVVTAAQQHPIDTQAAYTRAAAQELLDQRHLALDRLRQHGALVLDVPADQLSIAVISRYLALKARTQL